VATLADDLARFIAKVGAGPVHLVAWSFGGEVLTVAMRDPSLICSLILYEPIAVSVLPPESPEGKAAREERANTLAPFAAAAEIGDFVQAAKLLREAQFQLTPGGFERLPQDWRTTVLDNARVVPLLRAAPIPPAITCDMLKNFAQPTLVMRGGKTQPFYALNSTAICNCIPGARQLVLQNVNHDGPQRDPTAFTAAVVEFLSRG